MTTFNQPTPYLDEFKPELTPDCIDLREPKKRFSANDLDARAEVYKELYIDDSVAATSLRLEQEFDDRLARLRKKMYQHRGWLSEFRVSTVQDEYDAVLPDTQLESIIASHHKRANKTESDTAVFLGSIVDANRHTTDQTIGRLLTEAAYLVGEPRWLDTPSSATVPSKELLPTILLKEPKWHNPHERHEDILTTLLNQEIIKIDGTEHPILTPHEARKFDERLNKKDIRRRVVANDIVNALLGSDRDYYDDPLRRRSTTRRWINYKVQTGRKVIERLEYTNPEQAAHLAQLLGMKQTNLQGKE
jgi:hypothetical protein